VSKTELCSQGGLLFLLVIGLSDVDVDIEIKRLYSHGRPLFLLIIGLSVVEVHNGN
jgi:hypothetical protein